MDCNRSKSISVGDVLATYHEWGIPHFQRGSVWGVDNVSRLLESLYHGTPCGSIILWKQSRQEFGVPLVGRSRKTDKDDSGNRGFKYLIVDGQQRTRSLVAAFLGGAMEGEVVGGTEDTDKSDGDSSDSDAGGALKKFWSVNLERIPEFKDILKPDPKAAQAPMFVLVEDLQEWNEWLRKKEEKADEGDGSRLRLFNKPHLRRSVPLKFFFGPKEAQAETDAQPETEKRLFEVLKERLKKTSGIDESSGELSESAMAAIKVLSRRIRDMKRREFFLSTLKTSNLGEVIDVFIRINSGGRPVDEEERAYSQLLRVCPGKIMASRDGEPVTADGWINSIFEVVHGSGRNTTALENRDLMLARANERALGFKFFLRSFILAASYHSRTEISGKAFSFNVLYDPTFLEALGNAKDNQIWWRTRNVSAAIAELIREELCLDSFRFLPGARVLWPVMMALIRFPGMMTGCGTREVSVLPGYRKALAYVALKLTLANQSDRWLMERVAKMAGVRTSARDAIDDLLKAMEFENFESALDRTLGEANSLLSMPVLMLYGFERSKKARDFLYRNQKLVDPTLFCPPKIMSERIIEEASKPEKQHIVPYSRISVAYGLESMARISSHPINNVGNLTYLSHDMNGLDGLGDTLLDFNDEPQSNLEAHCLTAGSLQLYRQLCQLLQTTEKGTQDNAALKDVFEKWTKSRRHDIRDAFMAWLKELKAGWLEMMAAPVDIDHRIEPEAPVLTEELHAAGLEYVIRGLNLDNRIEDKLIEAFAESGWHCERQAGGALKLRWKNGTRFWIPDVRMDLNGLDLEIDGVRHVVSFVSGKDVDSVVTSLESVMDAVNCVQKRARDESAAKRKATKDRRLAKAKCGLPGGN